MPPRVTREMKDRLMAEARRRPPKRSPFKGEMPCPYCDGTMVYREDLVLDHARAGERLVIANLSGHQCRDCGEQMFDALSSRIISDRIEAERPRGGYELRITGLSKGKVGLYLTGDLVREMRIAKGQGFLAIPLSRDKMLLERVRAEA